MRPSASEATVDPNPHPTRQIHLSRRYVIGFAAVATFFAGTLFSGAAAAAGVDRPDVLALLFALGGCATLFLLLVWYIMHLTPVQPEEGLPGSKVSVDPFDQGTAWKQSRRPPSGTTIMWAANALRRWTGAASPR
jgi:hypothetical protein